MSGIVPNRSHLYTKGSCLIEWQSPTFLELSMILGRKQYKMVTLQAYILWQIENVFDHVMSYFWLNHGTAVYSLD